MSTVKMTPPQFMIIPFFGPSIEGDPGPEYFIRESKQIDGMIKWLLRGEDAASFVTVYRFKEDGYYPKASYSN